MRHNQRLAQIRHHPNHRLQPSPIQYSAVITIWDMNTKIGMDQGWTIRVEHELTSKLQAGMDAIALGDEVMSYYGDAIFMAEEGVRY
jgi:hypothetical protein